MVLLTLDPSASDIQAHLTPLSTRLQDLETKLRNLNLWHPPLIPPKSPEYSIIDISDLSSAITLIESAFHQQYSNSKHGSAHLFFAKYQWTWDSLHHEFCTTLANNANTRPRFIYLSSWRLDDQRQVWEYVSMHGVDMGPEDAMQWVGSWEDWRWDAAWKEWFLDVGDEERKARIYASTWEARQGGEEGENEAVEWVYIGGSGAGHQ
jgi:hypothetical protein